MSVLTQQPGAARFPDRLRLPFEFDPTLLARDLQALSSIAWTRHFVRANYDGDWSVIPLRAPAGETHPIRMIGSDPACRTFVDTPLLDHCPYFAEVMRTFRCPLRTVRLMRLASGSVIKEHTDVDLRFEDGMVRIHIPVVTTDQVEFVLNGSRVAMEAGSAWYLRLSDPHRVVNNGPNDRVHLVLDGFVNDWIAHVFEAAAAGTRVVN
jgi:hypothetical protein